ncbi:transcription elongation factor 1 family protein [bacterium]|nr:transcription elongation factor 1 family protein [bacterium]
MLVVLVVTFVTLIAITPNIMCPFVIHLISPHQTHRRASASPANPPPKKVAPKVDTMFTCPFCNHDKAVVAKMDHLTEKGLVECTVCGQKYTCNITHLSEPIDVYSDWIDACDKANKEEEGVEKTEEEDL